MNKSNNDINHTLSQELIDKYLAGELSNEEAHRVEKIMLDSDFDQEAMDGFEEAYPEGNIGPDLSALEKKIDVRTAVEKKAIPLWLKIAASVIILAISTVFVLNINTNDLKENGLAEDSSVTQPTQEKEEVLAQEAGENNSNMLSDSLLAINDNPPPVPAEPLVSSKESQNEMKNDLLSSQAGIVVEESEADDDQEISYQLEELSEVSESAAPFSISKSAEPVMALPPKKLTGEIKSNTTGDKIAGVTVMVKGTNIGTVTDINGNFSLEVPNTHDTVVINTMGFVAQEFDVRSVEKLDIGLDEDFSDLSEVVVTNATDSDRDLEDVNREQKALRYSSNAIKAEENGSRKKKKGKRTSGLMGTRTISGKVLGSEDSLSLPGVNILVEGTPTYTQTDENGKFKVEIPDDPEASLALAFIGHENAEIEIGDHDELEIYLLPDTTKQSDIVVVDYEANRVSLPALLTRARPAGGNQELTEYIAQNMQRSSGRKADEGKVIIEFTIQPTGELTDFNIVKGLNSLKNEEAERLLKEGPRWVPAVGGGKPQKDKVRVRIKFDK